MGALLLIILWSALVSQPTSATSDNQDFLMDKYGLTEDEVRTFNFIQDPDKRDQYLNYVIRSKLTY
jgi:hypothetical protein